MDGSSPSERFRAVWELDRHRHLLPARMVAGTTWFVSKTGIKKMTEHKTNTCCAGIDVSKEKLDAVVMPGAEHLVVAYTKEGLKELDAFLSRHKVERIGFEASGGYERRLLEHLRTGSIPAVRVQPKQVRAFSSQRSSL
jgi:hypothetical protein